MVISKEVIELIDTIAEHERAKAEIWNKMAIELNKEMDKKVLEILKDKKCDHQVIRRNEITGDPKQIEVECIKCGLTAKRNLRTGETK